MEIFILLPGSSEWHPSIKFKMWQCHSCTGRYSSLKPSWDDRVVNRHELRRHQSTPQRNRLVSCYGLVWGEGGKDVSNYLRVRMHCHRACITEDSTTLEWGLNIPPQHKREGSSPWNTMLFQWMKCLWNELCMWTSTWLSSACSTTCQETNPAIIWGYCQEEVEVPETTD